MQNLLVIRFGSLGDLCLLGWSLAGLAGGPGAADRRVTLVTKQAFAPLMAAMEGVDEVVPLAAGGFGGLLGLAAELRRRPWDTVLDAHGVLRSHGLLALLGRRPRRRIGKDTVRRLALLRGAAPDPSLERTMRQRFDEVITAAGTPAAGPPRPPLSDLRVAEGAVLGLAPGAQWDTKRWPEERFADLLTWFRARHPHPVRVFLGPREQAWFPGSRLARAAAAAPDVEIVQGRDLPEVARLLARCAALVTNDSGLLHLAEATGTPVLAVFGPTVRQFGYFPCLPASAVLETDLACRPCSRNGKAPCHRGDLACLTRLPAEAAHPFLTRMFPA